MPLNLQMEKTIIENAHLIEGRDMPPPFLALLSHVEVYKITIRKWREGDYSQHTAYINFPISFEKYVVDTFYRLKHRQARLMDSSKS